MPLETFASLFGTLAAVLIIIGLAYWFTRHVAGSGVLGGIRTTAGDGRMQVVAQLTVGKDQRLLVAAVGERYFLLGITPGGISLLTELTEEEAAQWRRKEDDAPAAAPGFRDALRSYMQKKR